MSENKSENDGYVVIEGNMEVAVKGHLVLKLQLVEESITVSIHRERSNKG